MMARLQSTVYWVRFVETGVRLYCKEEPFCETKPIVAPRELRPIRTIRSFTSFQRHGPERYITLWSDSYGRFPNRPKQFKLSS